MFHCIGCTNKNLYSLCKNPCKGLGNFGGYSVDNIHWTSCNASSPMVVVLNHAHAGSGLGTWGDFKISVGPSSLQKISPNWSSYHLHTGPNILMVYNPFGRVQTQWGPCKLGWGNFLVHSDGPTGGHHPWCATCAPGAPNYSTHTYMSIHWR